MLCDASRARRVHVSGQRVNLVRSGRRRPMHARDLARQACHLASYVLVQADIGDSGALRRFDFGRGPWPISNRRFDFGRGPWPISNLLSAC
jgi:hypothetical protein